MQAGSGDFNGIRQDLFLSMAREEILRIIARELTESCGEAHPKGICQRARTELGTIMPSSGEEPIARRGVHDDGQRQEAQDGTGLA